MSNAVAPPVPVGGFITDLIAGKIKAAILAKWQEIKDAVAAGDTTKIKAILDWVRAQAGVNLDLMQLVDLYYAIRAGNVGPILKELSDVLAIASTLFPVVSTDPSDPSLVPNPSIRVPVMLTNPTGDPLADANDAIVTFEQTVIAPTVAAPGQPVKFIPEAVAIIGLLINLYRLWRDKRTP